MRDRFRALQAGRRAALRRLSAMGVAPLAAAVPPHAAATSAAPACVLAPAQTEGPFFVDERLARTDLVGNSVAPGLRNALPLKLAIALVSARGACAPIAGMQVDV